MRQSVIERQLSQVHSSGSYFADPLVPTLHSPVRGLLAIHRQGAEHRRRFLAETFRNAQLPITTLLKACQETSLITRQTARSALGLLILGHGESRLRGQETFAGDRLVGNSAYASNETDLFRR